MAKNVFISFRFDDGNKYKDYLSNLFDKYRDTIDYSEDVDRSQLSDATIQRYLYGKLRRSSVTIILLTPLAVNHKKNRRGEYDDWMYDEIRYSLENREGNRTNGLVTVYTPEATDMIVRRQPSGTISVNDIENLFRKNMMNVKQQYKVNPTPGIFDRDYDSYCSLISWKEFIKNIGKYIDIAAQKQPHQRKPTQGTLDYRLMYKETMCVRRRYNQLLSACFAIFCSGYRNSLCVVKIANRHSNSALYNGSVFKTKI